MDLLSYLWSLSFTLGAFILAMLIIVAIHELGHYLAARAMGIHADVFSIGFGRKIYERVDRHGTAWRIAWIPAGGFVKFHNPPEGEPSGKGTYREASLPARSFTILAGPMANFIFSVLVFASVTVVTGLPTKEPTIGASVPLPVMADFQPGDRILSIGGIDVSSLSQIRSSFEEVPPSPETEWVLDRSGDILVTSGPFPRLPRISDVRPASPADAAGLRSGDVILSVNGEEVFDFSAVREATQRSEGRPMAMSVWNTGVTRDVLVQPIMTDMPGEDGAFVSNLMIGVSFDFPFLEARRTPGPLEALHLGVSRSADIITVSISAISNIVQGVISHCNIRGVITMAEISGSTANQGAQSFILFIAVLSVIIGFMNLLPIPVLDGGHLVFHAWEAVSGKAPSHKFAAVMMTFGVVVLVSLMGFGLMNDLMCR